MKRNHVLWMIICCVGPAVALAAVFVFNNPTTTVVLAALVLFCPLSHILMMNSAHHDHAPQVHESPISPLGGTNDGRA